MNSRHGSAGMYRVHEREKKRAMCARRGALIFYPLVLSATGGMGNEATNLFKRLASLLAEKWDSHYGSTLCWLRCRLPPPFRHPGEHGHLGVMQLYLTSLPSTSSLPSPAFTVTMDLMQKINAHALWGTA